MSDLLIDGLWVREIAKHATYSGYRLTNLPGGIRGTAHPMMVALSHNNFDKLEDWAHENMAVGGHPTYAERSIWHNLLFYGVPFTYDRTVADDEVRIKEKP
jgi:hypothetical protein